MTATFEQSASAAEPKGAERRRAPRFPHRSIAQLFMLPSGRLSMPINVTVIDYSSMGIGLLSRKSLIVGQKYVVREPFLTRDSSSMYTVVRSDARGDGSFSIGLMLSNTLTDEFDLPEGEPIVLQMTRRMKVLLVLFALAGIIKIVQLIF